MSIHRGICATPSCNNKQVVTTYNYNNTGMPYYRKWCQQCHVTRTAGRHGLNTITQVVAKNAGYSSVPAYLNAMARQAGFSSHTARLNSTHPYRMYRKNYCENKDKRLGFKCKYKILHSAQLQVDHIDGNPTNNNPNNLQTLCANCHAYKTYKHKNYLTPGRKKLKANSITSTVSVQKKTKVNNKLLSKLLAKLGWAKLKIDTSNLGKKLAKETNKK